MTGIIAGVSATWARIATDSDLSTAEGDGSNGMKPFVLSHLAAVIAGRGNDELFWIIAMEATKFDVPFDDLARFLPDIIVDTTLGVMAALALPPDRRESELFLAGWPAAADRPAIHAYAWRHGQSRIKHRTIVGQDTTIGIITAPHVRNMKATDLTTNDGLLATMRRQSAQAEAASGQKSIGGKVIGRQSSEIRYTPKLLARSMPTAAKARSSHRRRRRPVQLQPSGGRAARRANQSRSRNRSGRR
jgi:hypothetical protein